MFCKILVDRTCWGCIFKEDNVDVAAEETGAELCPSRQSFFFFYSHINACWVCIAEEKTVMQAGWEITDHLHKLIKNGIVVREREEYGAGVGVWWDGTVKYLHVCTRLFLFWLFPSHRPDTLPRAAFLGITTLILVPAATWTKNLLR